jgi:hypothetical protein
LWSDRNACCSPTPRRLFTIFESSVTVSSLRATGHLVARLIDRELRHEGLPPDTSADLKPEGVILSKTADRSVLGADMAFPCEHTIISSADLGRTDLAELGRLLGRNINTDRGHGPPIELAAAPPGRRQ